MAALSPAAPVQAGPVSRSWIPTAVGLAAAAFLALLFAVAPDRYAALLHLAGEMPEPMPFLDMSYILAAGECAQRGIDVYAANPCDPHQRVYDYSPFLLALLPPGVSVAWSMAAGIATIIVFHVSLAWLPWPNTGRDRAVMIGAVLSTMTLYALERGQIDALIFPVLVLAGAAMAQAQARRGLAYAALIFVGLLKFYPAAALAVALRERRRTVLGVAAVGLACFALFAALQHDDILRGLANRPQGFSFTDGFAAANLPEGMAVLVGPLADRYPALGPLLPWLPPALGLILVVRLLAQARRGALRLLDGRAALDAAVWGPLVIGAATVSGCFLAGFNIYFRGIHLLLALPGLMLLAEAAPRFPARAASLAILFLMWSEAPGEAIIHLLPETGMPAPLVNLTHAFFWMIRELVWWRVIAVLVAVLFWAAAGSDLGRSVLDRLPPRLARALVPAPIDNPSPQVKQLERV